MIRTLQGVLRVSQWWASKAVPLVAIAAVAYSKFDPQPNWATLAYYIFLFVVSVVGIAGFGYLLNDAFDVEGDRVKGRENALTSLGRNKTYALFGLLAILAYTPLLGLPGKAILVWLYLTEFLLFALYSMPQVRLKEKGVFGVVADSLYGHVIPSLSAWVALVSIREITGPVYAIGGLFLLAWQLPLGMRHILGHQLGDYSKDRSAGEETFVIAHGTKTSRRLIGLVLTPIELAGLISFLIAIIKMSWIPLFALVAFAIFRCWITLPAKYPKFNLKMPTDSYSLEMFSWHVLSEFSQDVLPPILLLSVAHSTPSLWPVLILYPIFRNDACREYITKAKTLINRVS